MTLEESGGRDGVSDLLSDLTDSDVVVEVAAASGSRRIPDAGPALLPYWGNPVWKDEFDGDLSKWNVRTRATLGLLNDTGEVTSSAVSIADSALHIKATWKATPKAEGPQGILTHDTGYIELPNGKKYIVVIFTRIGDEKRVLPSVALHLLETLRQGF